MILFTSWMGIWKSVGPGTSGNHYVTIGLRIKWTRGAGCSCENRREEEPKLDKTLPDICLDLGLFCYARK